jgi:hypothetical protein
MAKKLAVTFFLVSLIVLASAVGEGPRKVSTKTTRKLKITSLYGCGMDHKKYSFNNPAWLCLRSFLYVSQSANKLNLTSMHVL